jgi:hypothetical protein
MQNEVQINILETFENTVETVISYLAQRDDEYSVIEKVEGLIEHFVTKVEDNPFMYSRCSELVGYGVVNIRDFKRNGFRILHEVYEADGKTVVNILLLLRQNQNIQDQLIEHCVLYK